MKWYSTPGVENALTPGVEYSIDYEVIITHTLTNYTRLPEGEFSLTTQSGIIGLMHS